MSNINVMRKNLGPVTAYKYAVQQGYTGTEQEFAALMASYATVAETATQAADDAVDAKTAAEAAQAAAEAAAQTLVIDTTLTQSGQVADAKVTGDAINIVKADLDALTDGVTSFIPPKVADDSFYTQHSENSFYVSNRVITKGSTVTTVRIKSNSTRTGKIYLIDASTHEVLFIQSVSVESGWNTYALNWLSPSNCYIGFNGCYIDFRSGAAVTDDDTLLNDGVGLYEGSPKTAALGDVVTITQSSATGKYAFAVDVVIAQDGVIKKIESEVDGVKSEVDGVKSEVDGVKSEVDGVKSEVDAINDTVYNGFELDNGNLLHYIEIDDQIGYLGRWWDYNNKKCTNADGSELYFKTAGASTATLALGQISEQTVTPYIAISIDGGDFFRQQIDNPTITLPDTGEHLVRIMIDGMAEKNQYQSDKWEKRVGVYVTSLTVDAGIVTGIMPVNKVGMFFGDSITEGINALGTGANSSVNSASNAFPYFCTKVLNAVSYRVGYGGTGLTVTSSFHPCIDAIDWDAYRIVTCKFDPDFIVINHGVNDYGANTSAETYITAYKAVINRLRVKYSSTPIFCVVPFRSYQPYSSEIESMCVLYPNCYFVSSAEWNGETTDGTHLSALGAKNNGEKLAVEILKVLGKRFFINVR